MAWFRSHAVAIASLLLVAATSACAAYAATASRIAVLEEKVQDISQVKANVLILCTHLHAPCRDR